MFRLFSQIPMVSYLNSGCQAKHLQEVDCICFFSIADDEFTAFVVIIKKLLNKKSSYLLFQIDFYQICDPIALFYISEYMVFMMNVKDDITLNYGRLSQTVSTVFLQVIVFYCC